MFVSCQAVMWSGRVVIAGNKVRIDENDYPLSAVEVLGVYRQ